MRKILFIMILCFVFAVPAFAESVRLAWDPSPSADVAGYSFYLKEQVTGAKQTIGGVSVGATHPTTGTTTNFVIEGNKEYVIVATAYDARGNESADSNPAFNSATHEVVIFCDTTPPQPPGDLSVQERIAKALEELVTIARAGVPVRHID